MNKKENGKVENRPVFIEVPKPVNQMSVKEKDAFVEEIIKAITEQYK